MRDGVRDGGADSGVTGGGAEKTRCAPTRARPGAFAGAPLWLLDLALLAVALGAGYVLRFHLEVGALQRVEVASKLQYLKVYALLCTVATVLAREQGLYRTDLLRDGIDELYAIAKVMTLSTGLVLGLTFFYRSFSYSRLTFVYFWAIAICLLGAAHAAHRHWRRTRWLGGRGLCRAVLLGRPTSHVVDRLVRDPSLGFRVLGYLVAAGGTDDQTERGAPPATEPGARSGPIGALVASARGFRTEGGKEAEVPLERLGGPDDLPALLEEEAPDDVLILEQGLSHRRLLEAIDLCEQRGVRVRLVPPIYDLLVGPRDFSYVGNVAFIRVDERRYRRVAAWGKRAVDVALSAVGLLVSLPLLAALAAWIRRDSAGPVLYSQVRAGEGGRPFRLFKLRTMVSDAEARLGDLVDLEGLKEPVFKLDDDPRVTRVGRLLRRTSLDELPQLWNVLRGDMSLVGPRPEEVAMVERYDVWQRRRLKVKPGITGLQQVTCRGTPSLDERVRLDVYYIRKQSLLFDVLILLRTVWVVLHGRGAR